MRRKSITTFFKEDKPSFASYDNMRKIPSWIDGLKISQRKLLWTAFDKAAGKDMVKTETFANITALDTAYVHGAGSLCSVTASLVQEFPGACNYQYLNGNSGGWGCRQIPRESAPRYTKIKLSQMSSVLFNKVDREILERQYFEGQYIEPKFLMPIFPTLFLNSSEGLSTGFASRIYSRNPNDVISYIKKKLSGTEKPRMQLLPWFRGFIGEVRKNEETGQYESVGVIERNHTTSYTIKELPIGLEYTKFIEHLDKLCEDKVIVDYEDKCNPKTDQMLFEVKTTREFTHKHEDLESVIKALKLVRSLPENLTCIDEDNHAKEFSSVEELLDAFIQLRLKMYTKRKEHILGNLHNKLVVYASKYYFIKAIVDGQLVVNKKKKDEIVAQLEKFEKIQKVDGSYDIYLAMPICALTKEKMEELKKLIEDGKEEFKRIKSTTIEQMWLDDLHELQKMFK